MVVTLPGGLTANAQNRVEVEYKREPDLAPIHRQHMEERTAMNWEKLHLPENATLENAQVKTLPRDMKKLNFF